MSRKYECLIVDDEPLALELIETHINQIPQLVVTAKANSAIEALQLLKEHSYDLLFLDIQMPVLTGIELLKTLQNPPSVIFTTAYREYAVESYELNVVDYLVKPITFLRFVKAVDKFLITAGDQQSQSEPLGLTSKTEESIFVNVNKKYVKVIFNQITYIESVKDYIHIHTQNETIITKDRISEFEKKLPGFFLRIHRSFIVSRKHITAFTAQDIEIGNKEIPIGKSYKNTVLEELQK